MRQSLSERAVGPADIPRIEGAIMRVLSLAWVGTRTAEYAATVAFFKDVIGLGVHSLETDFAVLEVPDGATVEVFGPSSPYNRHLTHPVAGFLVADLEEAVAELRAAGVDIVLDPAGRRNARVGALPRPGRVRVRARRGPIRLTADHRVVHHTNMPTIKHPRASARVRS
jgi:catechol 2,3-dioxygenase-like lactoylglutathione lyase family enzyme